MNDILYMQRCLDLAYSGAGKVAPNPLVGSVVVHENLIIGEGYHRALGLPHAEVEAIAQITNRDLLSSATLYVNLEPCAHFGRTPPCASLIIASKIPRVVVACLDPNVQVSGQGIQLMKSAGISVEVGVLEKEARHLNRRFMSYHEKKRPYVILKWAQSEDGFMDMDRDSDEKGMFVISSSEAKIAVHQWRSEEASILVGKNTALRDNPQLNVRLVSGKNPIRVVVDTHNEVPMSSRLFNEKGKVIVLNTEQSIESNSDQIQRKMITQSRPAEWLSALQEEKINSVFVEGGAAVLNSFIASGLWDEARIITAPFKLNKGLASPILPNSPIKSLRLGTDQLDYYFNT